MTQLAHQDKLYQYALRLGDTATVISQRYCELVGTAPTLEEEIALANMGLDLLGQATAWLDVAAAWSGTYGCTADQLAYWRDEREYSNYLLAELDNGDFAQIILRGYCLSHFLHLLYREMLNSPVGEFSAIAQKAIKEVDYHTQHQGLWLERLGNGTEESHRRLDNALAYIWPYTQELFVQDDVEQTLTEAGLVPDKAKLQAEWLSDVTSALNNAQLNIPECEYFQQGGIHGVHTEQLGYLLAEMQSLTRAHPSASW